MTDLFTTDDLDPDLTSKSDVKREFKTLQKFAAQLVNELSKDQIASLNLPEATLAAITEGRRLNNANARQRHCRFIAKQLSQLDYQQLQAQLENADTVRQHAHQQALMWRDRLLDEPESLQILLNQQQHVDRQHLNQLLRNAKKSPDNTKTARVLLRYLQEIFLHQDDF